MSRTPTSPLSQSSSVSISSIKLEVRFNPSTGDFSANTAIVNGVCVCNTQEPAPATAPPSANKSKANKASKPLVEKPKKKDGSTIRKMIEKKTNKNYKPFVRSNRIR